MTCWKFLGIACLLLADGFGACSSDLRRFFLTGLNPRATKVLAWTALFCIALIRSTVPVLRTMSAALSPDDVTLGMFVEIGSFVVTSYGQVNNEGCYWRLW